jgi:hypothetical protein
MVTIKNLITTVRKEAIGSSFIATENYFVSTVNQNKMQSNYPKKYSTVIKKSGASFQQLLILISDSAAEAVANHVALIRMAASIDVEDWSEKEVVGYQPKAIMDAVDSESKNPNNFSSDYCQSLLAMSQINIVKPNHTHLIILVVIIVIGVVFTMS